MARGWILSVMFFGFSFAVPSTWALDISGCVVSLMRAEGDAFFLAEKGGTGGETYKKQSPKPTPQCSEVGVQSVVIGAKNSRVLYAELKWPPAPELKLFEALPDRTQGAISAQIARAADREAQHLINLPGLSEATFVYGLYGKKGAYTEAIYWGVDEEGVLSEK